MHFSANTSFFPVLLVILVVLYILIYLPIKFAVNVVAFSKAKADRVHKLHSNVVVAEYEPPEKLSPAELGYLFDNKLNIEEVFATIISLEQQGLITTIEKDGKLILNHVEPVTNSMSEFEKSIINQFKNNGNIKPGDINIGPLKIEGSPIALRSIKDNEVIDFKLLKNLVWRTENVLRDDLRKKGYLKSKKEQMRSLLIRLIPFMFGLLCLTIYIFHPKSIGEAFELTFFFSFFAPFYFVVAAFLLNSYQKIAGDPWSGTQKLKDLWPEIEGYRQYIKAVEEDRLKFESENTKGIVKDNILPYAIALGFDTGWKNKIIYS
jgi:hypothetical protein